MAKPPGDDIAAIGRRRNMSARPPRHGLAYLPQAYFREALTSGGLVEVLGSWRKAFEPYHLYYPSRRNASPAFSLLVNAFRYKEYRLFTLSASDRYSSLGPVLSRLKTGAIRA